MCLAFFLELITAGAEVFEWEPRVHVNIYAYSDWPRRIGVREWWDEKDERSHGVIDADDKSYNEMYVEKCFYFTFH